MLRRTIVPMVLAIATPVWAEPHLLSSQDIQSAVTGSLMAIDAPMGQTIPIRFGQDGLISGEAGILAAVLGARKDRGRWWVADDHLCLKFFRWFDAKERCITVRMDGNKLWWSEPSGENGTATLVELGTPPPHPAPAATRTVTAAVPKVTKKIEQTSKTAVMPEPVAVAAQVPVEPARADVVEAPAPKASATSLLAFISPAAAAEISTPSGLAGAASVATLDKAPLAAVLPPAKSSTLSLTPLRAEKAKPAAKTKLATQTQSNAVQLKKQSESTPKVAEPAGPLYRVARVEAHDILNVRNAPSEYAKQIGAIEPGPGGHGIRITGACDGLWCPIRHAKTSGWVNRYYLAEDLPEN